jgi:hypothetical protein
VTVSLAGGANFGTTANNYGYKPDAGISPNISAPFFTLINSNIVNSPSRIQSHNLALHGWLVSTGSHKI